MHDTILLAVPLLLGLASGFIAGIATGGGMINIPALIFMGLSPSAAIATSGLTITSSVTSAFKYHRSKLINLRQVLPLFPLACIGGIIGSKLLLGIDQHIMEHIFGAICIALACVIALNKKVTRRKTGRIYSALGLLGVLLTDIFASFFGTGGGILMVYVLSYFYGLTILEANASAKLLAIGGANSSVIIFLQAGIINFSIGVPLMIGSAIGGYIGAHTAIKKGDARVRIIFLTVVIASGIKLLIF